MSGVLSPVGPHPARVYWVRRLVVIGVPLILILIIAVSCSGGGGKPSGGAATEPTTSTTTTTSSDPDAACVPGDLQAQLSVSAESTIYQVGDSPTFTATITNVSGSTCTFTSTPANEIWTVYSGPTKFWTTAGCQAVGSPTTKQLAPGTSRTLTISWDGKRQEPNCTHDADPVDVGTYHLHAKLDGVSAKQVTFHFHANTA